MTVRIIAPTLTALAERSRMIGLLAARPREQAEAKRRVGAPRLDPGGREL